MINDFQGLQDSDANIRKIYNDLIKIVRHFINDKIKSLEEIQDKYRNGQFLFTKIDANETYNSI